MPRVITERGEEMLDSYPQFLQRDHLIRAICNATGEEMVGFDEQIDLLAKNTILFSAEEYLYIFEEFLGIAAPATASLAERKAALLAFMQRATMDGSGAMFELVVTLLIGNQWSYTVGGTNFSELTVVIPYVSGSFQAELTEILLRQVIPASMSINVTYAQGFILDESLLDEDLL